MGCLDAVAADYLSPADFPNRMRQVVKTIFPVQAGIAPAYENRIGNAWLSEVGDLDGSGFSQGGSRTWFSEDTRLIFPYNDTTQGGNQARVRIGMSCCR